MSWQLQVGDLWMPRLPRDMELAREIIGIEVEGGDVIVLYIACDRWRKTEVHACSATTFRQWIAKLKCDTIIGWVPASEDVKNAG